MSDTEVVPEIHVMKMQRRHLNDVIAIEADVFANPWSTGLFLAELSKGSRSYYVAESDGELIGFAGMMYYGNGAHLLNVAVTPAFQRHKVGTRLFHIMMAEAIEQGVESIYLEFRRSNVVGYSVYSKFGFEVVDVRKGYYIESGEDGIVMAIKDAQDPKHMRTVREVLGRLGGVTGEGLPGVTDELL